MQLEKQFRPTYTYTTRPIIIYNANNGGRTTSGPARGAAATAATANPAVLNSATSAVAARAQLGTVSTYPGRPAPVSMFTETQAKFTKGIINKVVDKDFEAKWGYQTL